MSASVRLHTDPDRNQEFESKLARISRYGSVHRGEGSPMPTECSAKPMGFARVDGRAVLADFDGGAITSNAGGLLLGATDRAIGLVESFATCFADGRTAERVVHEVVTLVGQRVLGIALGYEDLIGHDPVRHDPVSG